MIYTEEQDREIEYMVMAHKSKRGHLIKIFAHKNNITTKAVRAKVHRVKEKLRKQPIKAIHVDERFQPTQIGKSESCDFDEQTWTFKMQEEFTVRAGEFAIVDIKVYNKMINALCDSKAYFGQVDGKKADALYIITNDAIQANKEEVQSINK